MPGRTRRSRYTRRMMMRTRPPMKMWGRNPITVLCLGRSGGGMWSCSWRSWLCSDMHTSLLCKVNYAPEDREIFCCEGNHAAMSDLSSVRGCMGGRMIWDVVCGSFAFGIAFVCLTLRKISAATRMTIMAIPAAMTTGRKLESPLRSSGVGSFLEACGSLMHG